MSGATDRDIATATAIGELTAKIEIVIGRQETMEKKLDSVVAMTNRWKGATALLIVIGGLLGYISNYLLKFAGKA